VIHEEPTAHCHKLPDLLPVIRTKSQFQNRSQPSSDRKRDEARCDACGQVHVAHVPQGGAEGEEEDHNANCTKDVATNIDSTRYV